MMIWDYVQRCADDNRDAQLFQATMQKNFPVIGVCENRPEVSGPACVSVLQASAQRDNRGERRLNDKPQIQRAPRAGDEVLPSARNHVGYRRHVYSKFTAFCAIRLLDFRATDHRRQQNIGGVRVLVASTTKGVDVTLGGVGVEMRAAASGLLDQQARLRL